MFKVMGEELATLTVDLEEGHAECMGDGMYVVLQRDERTTLLQNVVLTRQDLEAMLAAA